MQWPESHMSCQGILLLPYSVHVNYMRSIYMIDDWFYQKKELYDWFFLKKNYMIDSL